MSYEFKDITEKEVTDFFLHDPNVCYLGLSDVDLHELYEDKIYRLKDNTIYKGIYLKDELISILKYEAFTQQTVNLHFYLSSKLHKKGYARGVEQAIYNYFIENTTAIKAILMTPQTCTQVQGPAIGFGMELEGRIKKAIVWRNELMDILIYGIELKRDK